MELLDPYRIPLSQGQFAIVDEADYEWLSQWKWYATWSLHTKTFIAIRKGKREPGRRESIMMHREILGLKYGDRGHTDHINGNTLDNRRENLRVVTYSQNNMNRRMPRNNTSGHKGLFQVRKNGRWQVTLSKDKKRYYFGSYVTREEAIAVLNQACEKLHGEYARRA